MISLLKSKLLAYLYPILAVIFISLASYTVYLYVSNLTKENKITKLTNENEKIEKDLENTINIYTNNISILEKKIEVETINKSRLQNLETKNQELQNLLNSRKATTHDKQCEYETYHFTVDM